MWYMNTKAITRCNKEITRNILIKNKTNMTIITITFHFWACHPPLLENRKIKCIKIEKEKALLFLNLYFMGKVLHKCLFNLFFVIKII